MPRKKVEIDDRTRKQIEQLAGYGLKDDQIALVVGLAEATMQRHCKIELATGRARGKATIGKTAFAMATSGKHPAMTIFMCKTQLGMRETQTVEFPDADGNPQDVGGVCFYIPDNGRDK